MLIHYELDGVVAQPLCQNNAGRDAFEDSDRDVEMTTRDEEVSCHECLRALGYQVPHEEAHEQLLDLAVKQITGERWSVAA